MKNMARTEACQKADIDASGALVRGGRSVPLPSEYGTYKQVTAFQVKALQPLSRKSPYNVLQVPHLCVAAAVCRAMRRACYATHETVTENGDVCRGLWSTPRTALVSWLAPPLTPPSHRSCVRGSPPVVRGSYITCWSF